MEQFHQITFRLQDSSLDLASVTNLHKERRFQAIYDTLAANGKDHPLPDDAKLLLAVACIWLDRGSEVSPLLGGAGPTERMLAKCESIRDWPVQDRQMLARYLMLRNPQDGNRIALSSFPKSGSTFLSECLLESTKTLSQEPVNTNNTLMQMVMDSIMLTRALGRPNTLTKIHLACNIKLQSYLVLYNIKPIVLFRNIFDTLRSFVDHLSTGHSEIVKHYPNLSFNEKKNIAIHILAMPLVEFFATWFKYFQNNECLVVHYEDAVKDWVGTTRRALNFSGFSVPHDRIVDSVKHIDQQKTADPGKFRYNIGIQGRGDDFTRVEKDRVRLLYKMYPQVNFEMIDDGN